MRTRLGKRLLKATLRSDRVWDYITTRRRKQTKSETDADPLKLLWVSPESIQFVAGPTTLHNDSRSQARHFKQFRSPGISGFGSVVDGDWDRSEERFDELPFYVGLQQRYENGIEWEDTAYYRYWSTHVEVCRHRLRDPSEKCKKYEKLFESIKCDGYKTQRQQLKTSPHKEIVVNIGRDGEFLFNGGGRHRLSIVKYLDLESVPVIVKIRHGIWQQIRDEIRFSNQHESLSDKAKSELDHPDLQDIRTAGAVDPKGGPRESEAQSRPLAKLQSLP